MLSLKAYLFFTSSLLIVYSSSMLFVIVVLINNLILSDVLLWYHAIYDSCTYSLPHLVWCFAQVPCFPWYLYLLITSSCLMFCSGIMHSMIVIHIHNLILSEVLLCYHAIPDSLLILNLIFADVLLWYHAFHDSCTYSLSLLCVVLLWYHAFHDSCTYSLSHIVWCFALVPCFLL